MTNKKINNSKNLLIAVAMLVILVVGSIGAYFTATDEASNKFTVGKIDIELTEPAWDDLPDLDENGIPDMAEKVLPNMKIDKDPTVTNLSTTNDAFVFIKVTVPKAEIITSNTVNGNKAAKAAVTQLFQLNDSSNTNALNGLAWDGTDTYNSDSWYLVKSETDDPDNNVYIFVYGNSAACTALAPGATTSDPLFNSVTFCNAVENQGLETKNLTVQVDAFAIQTTDLTASDKTAPLDVWVILNAQSGSKA